MLFIGRIGRPDSQLGNIQLGAASTTYQGGALSFSGTVRSFHSLVLLPATLGFSGAISKSNHLAKTVFTASLNFAGAIASHLGFDPDRMFFLGRLGKTSSEYGNIQLGVDQSYYIGALQTPTPTLRAVHSLMNILANLSFQGSTIKNSILARTNFSGSFSPSGLLSKNSILSRTKFTSALSFAGSVVGGLFKASFNTLVILPRRPWNELLPYRLSVLPAVVLGRTTYGVGIYGNDKYGTDGALGSYFIYGTNRYGDAYGSRNIRRFFVELAKRRFKIPVKAKNEGTAGEGKNY